MTQVVSHVVGSGSSAAEVLGSPDLRRGSLGERLRSSRRRVVGRTAERELFERALGSAPGALPFCVLALHGPGGVGKTTLLGVFADAARAADVPALMLNGRDMEATPASFLRALARALGSDTDPIAALAAPGRRVLMVDTFEALEPLEGWLRDQLLPQISEDTLVVLAGRHPISATWRGDLGWQDLLRTVPLRNLSPDESRELLASRQIPERYWDGVLQWAHGYPLALSLAGDLVLERPGADQDASLGDEPPPDIVAALLARFLDAAAAPWQRAALEVCALLRVTTEPILGRLLGLDDAHDAFEWLRGLSFVEPVQPGVALHSVARDALIADLRWRNPDRYVDLHRAARAYYSERLQQSPPAEQQRVLWDFIYLHHDNALVRSAFAFQGGAGVTVHAPCREDEDTLAGWVLQHEGEESARIFRHWWARPDVQTTLVFRQRNADGAGPEEAVGFLMLVGVHRAQPEDARVDAAVEAAQKYLATHAPLRQNEAATHFRFWMHRETYHAVSPVQSLIMVQAVRHYLTTPALAFSFFPVLDPDHWRAMLAYAEMLPIPDADYVVGRNRFAVFGHDWRAQPPTAWLSVLAEKEIAGERAARAAAAGSGARSTAGSVDQRAARPRGATADAILVLSEAEFGSAVRDALRDVNRPEALIANPLLRSRIVVELVGAQLAAPALERAQALSRLISRTSQGLEGAGKRDRAYRALYHTYLRPAPTQERAAEILDLPFSTYRRHLAEGIALVTDALWQREIGIGK